MKITWSDVLTFVLGLLASAVFVLGEALIKLDGETAVDWEKWGMALLIAELVSIGRYLTSRVPEWYARRQV